MTTLVFVRRERFQGFYLVLKQSPHVITR